MTKHRHRSDGLSWLGDLYRNIRPGWIKSRAALNEDGGALVEFTVMAPLFFLVVFGIIEWGSIYWLRNSMVNASREAARTVAVQGAVPSAANTTACLSLTGSGQLFTIATTDLCPGVPNVNVQVSVDSARASVFNYLGMFTGGTISSSATMRRELACPAVASGVVTCTCNTSVTPPTCS